MPYKKKKASSCGMKDAIETFDLFGHQISFNINGYGDTHKTANGAVFSIMVYVLYVLYLNLIV